MHDDSEAERQESGLNTLPYGSVMRSAAAFLETVPDLDKASDTFPPVQP